MWDTVCRLDAPILAVPLLSCCYWSFGVTSCGQLLLASLCTAYPYCIVVTVGVGTALSVANCCVSYCAWAVTFAERWVSSLTTSAISASIASVSL